MYDDGMEISSEKNARRILAIGVLFATIGILALVITLMQPTVQDEKERLANEIFQPSNEEKHEVMAELQASDSSGSEVSEAEKLRVLQSLQSQ
jgi:isopenicillin N synthase-like dioxygenase